MVATEQNVDPRPFCFRQLASIVIQFSVCRQFSSVLVQICATGCFDVIPFFKWQFIPLQCARPIKFIRYNTGEKTHTLTASVLPHDYQLFLRGVPDIRAVRYGKSTAGGILE